MPPFICWFQYAVKLKLLHIGVVHVVLGVSDHALYHFAADGAGLTGGDIAVIALLEADADGIGGFLLHLVQCVLGFLVRHGLFLSFIGLAFAMCIVRRAARAMRGTFRQK